MFAYQKNAGMGEVGVAMYARRLGSLDCNKGYLLLHIKPKKREKECVINCVERNRATYETRMTPIQRRRIHTP